VLEPLEPLEPLDAERHGTMSFFISRACTPAGSCFEDRMSQPMMTPPLHSSPRATPAVLGFLSVLALVGLLFSASGCSKNNQAHALEAQEAAANAKRAPLIGHWISDRDATIALVQEEAPELLDSFHSFALQYMVQSMHFDHTGALVFRASMLQQQSSIKGTYDVTEVNGETLTVTVQMIDEEEPDAAPETQGMHVTILSPNQIRLAPVPELDDTDADILVQTRIFTRTDAAGVEAAMDEAMNDPTIEELFNVQLEGEQEQKTANDQPLYEEASDLDPKLKARLYGHWADDLEATVAALPREDRAAARREGQNVRFGLIFDDKGRLSARNVIHSSERDMRATYFIHHAAGETLSLALTIDEDGHVETVSADVTFINNDTITFAPSPGPDWTEEEIRQQTIVLTRTTEKGLEDHLQKSQHSPN